MMDLVGVRNTLTNGPNAAREMVGRNGVTNGMNILIQMAME